MSIRGYIAASLDGYIADRDGGVGWLDPYEKVEAGYELFIAGISTVVVGRKTYDQIEGELGGWPYAGKRGIVVTSRDLGDPPKDVAAWRDGIDRLAETLRAEEGDAWVAGGAALQSAFIAARALDSLDLFVVPVLLGGGVRLFPTGTNTPSLSLAAVETLDLGMVRLRYEFEPMRER